MEAKRTWRRLSKEERDNVFVVPLWELFEDSVSLPSSAFPDYLDAAVEFKNGADHHAMLAHAVERLCTFGVHTVWQWLPDQDIVCLTPAEFRSRMRVCIGESLSQYLPEDGPTEMAPQIALRHRMCALLRTMFDGKERSHIDHINLILDAFVDEHQYIYHSILNPVKEYMQQQLPELVGASPFTCMVSSDLQKLNTQQLDEVCTWLMSRVVMFSGNIEGCIKSDTRQFQLTPNGRALTVHQSWLQTLKNSYHEGDEHTWRVIKGPDPEGVGLALDWVYGCYGLASDRIYRHSKCGLGAETPSVQTALQRLIVALADMKAWHEKGQQGKQLLNDLLRTRHAAAENHTRLRAMKEDLSHMSQKELGKATDDLIIAVLQHEVLLTRACMYVGNKEQDDRQHQINILSRDVHEVSHKSLFSLATVSQDFSKRLELLKQWEADIASMIQLLMDTQRRLELPSLTDAQTQQASIDAGLDCAFVTLNSSVYHRLALLVKTAKSLVAGRKDMAASQCGGPEAELEMAHAVLMRAFWDVVHPNMYSVEDDHFFCSKLPAALKLVDDITQQGKAALPHMEALVIYLARDDSLEVLGPHLILPLIQQRLDGMQADAKPDSSDLRDSSAAQKADESSGNKVLGVHLPSLLVCPLTQKVLRQPVIAADGHTYEKAAIEEWLLQQNASPVTGLALAHFCLVPNLSIRSLILGNVGSA
ncbi:hypothetical protein WJX79_000254 [Trebouxia sp. C0005]